MQSTLIRSLCKIEAASFPLQTTNPSHSLRFRGPNVTAIAVHCAVAHLVTRNSNQSCFDNKNVIKDEYFKTVMV